MRLSGLSHRVSVRPLRQGEGLMMGALCVAEPVSCVGFVVVIDGIPSDVYQRHGPACRVAIQRKTEFPDSLVSMYHGLAWLTVGIVSGNPCPVIGLWPGAARLVSVL